MSSQSKSPDIRYVPCQADWSKVPDQIQLMLGGTADWRTCKSVEEARWLIGFDPEWDLPCDIWILIDGKLGWIVERVEK